MNDTETEWMLTERPRASTKQAAREYFGVPPSPESALIDNINKKRRRWHSRSNGPSGSEKAREVKEIIRQLENFLLKGGDFPHGLVDGSAPETLDVSLPPPIFSTIEELEALVDVLLQRGQFQRAIDTSREGTLRWPEAFRAQLLFAYAVAFAFNAGLVPSAKDFDEAIRASEIATTTDPINAVGWWSRSSLLAASGRIEEVLYLENEIVSRLGYVPPSVLIIIGRSVALTKDVWRGMEMIMRAVEADPTDSGIRQEAVSVALDVGRRLLPLSNDQNAVSFERIVAVASYCADGVASLESEVRPFRMWASRSSGRMFTGSHQLRSFLSILTAFAWLPIHGAKRNKACWRIVLDGPTKNSAQFFELIEMEYVRSVHRGVAMPWASAPNVWPTRPTPDTSSG